MRFDLRGCEIMASGHERPRRSSTPSEDGTVMIAQCGMSMLGAAGSAVAKTQEEPRSCEALPYRTHHGVEMSELLGRRPGALHSQDELVPTQRAEEIGNVMFRGRQRSGEVLTCQV